MNMNEDAMEQELQSEDTARLERALKESRALQDRSEAHESWAWTRLQVSLKEESASPHTHFWRWAAIGSAAVLAVLVFLNTSDTAQSTFPVAESQNPRVWASGFHFPEAQADVIWATGYDYIPASYSIK
jgi:hypothetical protein